MPGRLFERADGRHQRLLLRGLTPETLGAILDDFAAGKSPKPGSYIGRKASEPKDAIQTLTDPKLYDGSAAKKIKIPNLPEKPSKAKEPAV